MLNEDSLFKPCYKCGEEAPYFCRMCSAHMCPDCTCFHLSVAQAQNRYTERTKENANTIAVVQTYREGDEVCFCETSLGLSSEISPELERLGSLLPDVESMALYTTAGLEELLQLLNASSRLLRRELDKRFLSTTGSSYYEKPTYFGSRGSGPRAKAQGEDRPPKRRIPSRKEVGAYELLLDKVQQGAIPLKYIENILAKS